jgi:D-arabinose 1-dehydrogenase-like Zn-dependent alcohol dehydrogenase
VRAAQVSQPSSGVELVERPVPDPEPIEVRVEVAACALCGGDTAVLDGGHGVEYPRVPGHEVAGTVDAVGEDVTEWAVGESVAVGWHGGHCFTCDPCRRGEFTTCERREVTGIHRDGGLAEYTTVRREALAAVPDGVDLTAAAPLTCAGMTGFNALRRADVLAGDLVAVQGVGGVGHLAVQYADAMGFETAAISRGTAKREAALDLGADHYVDASDHPADALTDVGGAAVVLATAPSSALMETLVDGLAPNGTLLAVGAPDDPVSVPVAAMLGPRQSVQAWGSGHAKDTEDALATAARNGVEPVVETYPLSAVDDAVADFQRGDVRFRAVVEP